MTVNSVGNSFLCNKIMFIFSINMFCNYFSVWECGTSGAYHSTESSLCESK